MSPTDTDLIARVLAQDDRHAFGELVRQHQSAVRAFLRRLSCGQHALADDLAQETFLAAYRDLARFRGGSAFSTWLLGIAYNQFRSERRRNRPTVEWSGDVTAGEALPGYEHTAPAATGAVELRQDLAGALAQLSGDERAAIHLCYTDGLTHEEASAVLGSPLGTAKHMRCERRRSFGASCMSGHPPEICDQKSITMNASMQPTPDPLSTAEDRQLRQLFNDNAPAYVDDAGFTARVMSGLPAARRQRSIRRWLLVSAAFLVGASIAALLGGQGMVATLSDGWALLAEWSVRPVPGLEAMGTVGSLVVLSGSLVIGWWSCSREA